MEEKEIKKRISEERGRKKEKKMRRERGDIRELEGEIADFIKTRCTAKSAAFLSGLLKDTGLCLVKRRLESYPPKFLSERKLFKRILFS